MSAETKAGQRSQYPFNEKKLTFSICFCFLESDLIPGLVTFVACLLLALENGIVIGVATNLLFILYHAARPKISMQILKVSQNGWFYIEILPIDYSL